jgi:glycosyltransferase involved in cell wall biosynthesis
MVKVSIIIPVFNAQNYLRKCLDSLVEQTMADFEIICINDCSKDGSLSILEEYAAIDSRITIINNQSNKGAAESRNIGIDAARGEFLAILDSDDFCDKRFLESAYSQCKESEADIGVMEFSVYNDDNKKIINSYLPLCFTKYCSTEGFHLDELYDQLFVMFYCAPWTKLYRREFVINSKIRFQSLRNSNDTYFGHMILTQAEKIIYIDSPTSLYYYRVNVPSQITSNVMKDPTCILEALTAIKESLEQKELFNRYRISFYSRAVESFYYLLSKCDDRLKQTIYRFIRSEGLSRLGMLNCTREDFVSAYVYHRYQHLRGDETIYRISASMSSQDDLFAYLKESRMRCGLWGIGIRGKAFLEACDEHQFSLSCIIDEDTTKMGMSFGKYTVNNFMNSYETIDAVIITNTHYGKEISETIRSTKRPIKIIDADAIFKYGLKVQECVF